MKLTKLFKKTLIFFLLLFGFITVSISLFSVSIIYNRSLHEYEGKAVSIAESLTRSGLDVLLDQDAAAIQALLDSFLEIENISYGLYASSEKEILAHTFSPDIPSEVLREVELAAQNNAEKTIHTISLEDKGDFFCIGIPLLSGSGGFLHLGISKEPIMIQIRTNIIRLLILTGSIFFFCGLIGYFIINRVSQPLMHLTEYAQKIARGNFSSPPHIDSQDEVGMLALSMESMAKQLNNHFTTLEEQVSYATKEMNAALNHLTAIFDSVADGLIVTDEEGVIIRHNQQLLRIFGLPAKYDLVGSPVRDLLGITLKELAAKHPFNNGNDSQPVDASNHIIECRDVEFLTANADKKNITLELSISLLSSEKSYNRIAVVRDITKRKKAEEELRRVHDNLEKTIHRRTQELSFTNENLRREVEEKIKAENELAAEKEILSTTLSSIAEGVITLDVYGNVLMMNMVAEQLTGFEQQIAQSQTVSTVFRAFTPESNQPHDIDYEATNIESSPQARTKRLLLQSSDGQQVEISYSISPILNSAHNVVGSVLVFRDITLEKRIEEENIKAEKLTSLGILAGGIAHDFNNILTAILNNITMARLQMEGDAGTNKNLLQAESACKRAQKLTYQLLTFSKGGKPVRKVTSIKQIIDESVDFVLRGTSITCQVDAEEDMWYAEVDKGQISQVIDNLIINSAQAMSNTGKLIISAENVMLEEKNNQQLQSGPYVCCMVTDRGPGIPREKIDRIFDPYFTTKEGGSGLGLATSYSIIKNHKGFIEVDPSYKHGARFIFFLPAVQEQSTQSLEVKESSLMLGRGRVLVMDDEDEVRNIIRQSLSFLGYDAILTSDGKQAVDEYRKSMEIGEKIEMVIMDLTIPGGMGGKEAISAILTIDPHAKVIVSSGYSDDPVMANFSDYGFKGVLIKPYSLEQLSQKLHEIGAKVYQ